MNIHQLINELETPAAYHTTEYCSTPLPVDDAAKIAALVEMYPQHTSESLITALLHHAFITIEPSTGN